MNYPGRQDDWLAFSLDLYCEEFISTFYFSSENNVRGSSKAVILTQRF